MQLHLFWSNLEVNNVEPPPKKNRILFRNRVIVRNLFKIEKSNVEGALERIKNEVLPVLLDGVKKDGNINP